MPAGASVASSVAGGLLGASNANSANKNISNATNAANAATSQVYSTNQNNLNPYIGAGTTSENELLGLEGLGGASGSAAANSAFQNYLNSTNYQFALGQGEQSILGSNATALNSGATAKALDAYATGQAESALGGYESQLTGQTNTGESAAGTLGQLGTEYAGQISSNDIGSAEAEAGVTGAATNIEENALKGLTQAGTQAYTSSSYGGGTPGVASSNFGTGGALSAFGNEVGGALSGVGNAVSNAYNSIVNGGSTPVAAPTPALSWAGDL